MTFDIAEYIPHGLIVAFAAVAAWVFRDHVERDDARFKEFSASVETLSCKLDSARETEANNHAEILKILLEQRT